MANGTPRFGTATRDILTGPRLTDLDASIIKRFSLAEKVKVEFRGELFNLLNHPNFALPNQYIGNTIAGEITNTAGNSREVQFGLKAIF